MATQEQDDLKRVWATMALLQDQLDTLTKICSELVARGQLVPVEPVPLAGNPDTPGA